jgi:hypothetical protein
MKNLAEILFAENAESKQRLENLEPLEVTNENIQTSTSDHQRNRGNLRSGQGVMRSRKNLLEAETSKVTVCWASAAAGTLVTAVQLAGSRLRVDSSA